MNVLDRLQDPLAESIGWMLVHSLWIGCLIAFIVALALLAMRASTANSRYVVLFTALLAIPCTAFVWPLVGDTAQNPTRRNSVASNRNLVHSGAYPARSATIDLAPNGPMLSGGTASPRISRRRAAVQAATPSARVWTRTTWLEMIQDALPGVVLAWLVGVVALSIRLLIGCASIRGLRQFGTTAVADPVVRMTNQLARRLRISQTVEVVQSTLTNVPTTIGFFRPIVLLPLSVLTSLSSTELESILAHELAHIRRRDFLMNVVQSILEIVMFYHPAIWWISRKIRVEREHACDDLAISVLGDRLQYARALTEVAACATEHRLAMSAGGGELAQRIRRVLGRQTPSHGGVWQVCSAGILAILVLFVATIMLGPASSVAENDQQQTGQGAVPPASQPRPVALANPSVLKPIAGRVLGPDGSPLPGASVFLRRRPFRSHDRRVELGELVTGPNGRFEFRDVALPADLPTHFYPLDVIAMKPGHSIRWQRISNPQTDIKLRLKKEAVLQGRLIDDVGQPVGEAKVRVHQLMSLNTLQKIDMANGHYPSMNGDSFLDVSDSDAEISVVTAADGSFVLRQLPRRVGLVLVVDDRRLLKTKWYAATTDEELAAIPAGRSIRQPQPVTPREILRYTNKVELLPIHRTPAKLTATRGAKLSIQVVADRTDEPVEGVSLMLMGRPNNVIKTDANGYAELEQLVSGQPFRVVARPAVSAGLLAREQRIPQSQELELAYEIRLQPGAFVAGQVIDKQDRTGIKQVKVAFASLDANNRVDETVTDDDGFFRLVVPESQGHVVVTRVPAGYLPQSIDATTDRAAILSPDLKQPMNGVVIELRPRPAMPLSFVNEAGVPTAVSVDLRVQPSANTSLNYQADSDASGQLNVSRYLQGSSIPKAIQMLARSTDGREAAFFRTTNVQELEAAKAKQISLQPVAAVKGRVLDQETKTAIPAAKLNLSVNYTTSRGQGVTSFTADHEGGFRFDNLVPGMQYSIGASAKGYVGLNSINTRFVAEPSTLHAVDIELMSSSPRVTLDLGPVQLPATAGLDGKQALESLKGEYKVAREAYRTLLNRHQGRAVRERIVRLREPTAVYADAIWRIAQANADSDTELDALIWLCQSRSVVGARSPNGDHKRRAAKRILETYADRADLAAATSDIIYAANDSYGAAMRLMKNPNREVQGRACITAADIAAQRFREPYRGQQEVLRSQAIELYQKVIDEFADVSHWRYKTIGARAQRKLFQLTNLLVGSIAPEIEGDDLDGQPMKLSDFRGNVVVIHYWESDIDGFHALTDCVAENQGKPFVLVGVCTDKDLQQAIKFAAQKDPQVRHWHDPEQTIHSKWGNSWPNTHVISHDGRILYKGERETSKPIGDVIDQAVEAALAAQ